MSEVEATLGLLIGSIADTIDSMDDALLALVAAHNKLAAAGAHIESPFSVNAPLPPSANESADDELDVEEVLTTLEINEALREYGRKRCEFQINLHTLRQHSKALLDKPTVAVGSRQGKQELTRALKEKLKKGF